MENKLCKKCKGTLEDYLHLNSVVTPWLHCHHEDASEVDILKSRIKELEKSEYPGYKREKEIRIAAEKRVKELEDAIRRHKKEISLSEDHTDKELYSVLEVK